MDPRDIPLRDLHLPEPVSWWPPAPGWWLLMALLAVGVLWLLWRWLCSRQHHAARRHALRRLDQIARDYEDRQDPVELAKALSELLRRTMLAYAPRQDVAGLTGEAWLEWLDTGLAQPVFTQGPGRQILELPYRDPAQQLDVADRERLLAAVRHRLATPTGVLR